MVTNKRPGPALTSKGTLIGVRFLKEPLAALDVWISEHPEPRLSRPEAIRRLVEQALKSELATHPTSRKEASKARELAGQQLDRLADQSAPVEEQARRKARLLKGPREFRAMRGAHPKPKPGG